MFFPVSILPFVRHLFLFPSRFCLDAPLVAAGWALLLSRACQPAEPGALRAVALFFIVWAVYLADRLLDGASPEAGPRSDRHRFSAAHRRTLGILLSAAIVGCFGTGLIVVTKPLLLAAGWIAVGTGAYFLLFRLFARTTTTRLPLPGKEIVIAFCFTAGVTLGSGFEMARSIDRFLFFSLAALFLANCLLISLAESEVDRTHDPAAWFARCGRKSHWLIPACFAVSTALILAGATTGAFTRSVPISVGLSNALLTLLYLKRDSLEQNMQPLADGTLLLAWLFVPWI